MPGRRGRAMPGSWGLAAIRKKKGVLQSSPHGRTGATNVKETRLGEPVLGEPVLIGRAIKRGWGEPSNEVGASHQTRLGEPVLSRWASHSTTVDACFKAAPWRYGASARARSALCLLGTFSASSARARTPSTVPARRRGANFPTSARSALCLLGTCPLGTFS